MKNLNILFAILALIILNSCSSTKEVMNDDAVRIDLEKVTDLENFNPYIEPNTGKQRNPSTLRGNVFSVTKIKNDSTTNEYVIFLDQMAFNLENPKYEYIPIDIVDLQGPKIGLKSNWFENYNNPLNHDVIREVDTLTINNKGCGCSKITCPDCEIECPFPWQDRANNRSPIFISANIGIASYADKSPLLLTERGFDRPFGEFAIGYRFQDRSKAHFQLGLAYFTGIKVYENQTNKLLNRDALMLHGKYQFNEWNCIFPYVYGQIGASLDVNSIYMGKLALSTQFKGMFDYECDCEAELDADAKLKHDLALKAPEVDLSIPISIGLGAGFDIPVNKYFDISIDLGYKYMKIGETTTIYDFKVPTSKPMSIYTLRLGINY
jgi:opacity protein-like surface antigen